MAQMLAMVVNARQDDWDLHLPHVEFAYNSSFSAATGLALNEVHMGRLPRLPLTVSDRTGVVGPQSLARDHLTYCDLATDRQKRANDIVRAHHALTVSRVNRRNSALADVLRPAPNFATGGWAWVYSSASTVRQGVKANTEAKVLKAKFALNWTGPYKILTIGSCFIAEIPDGSPLGSNLLYLDLPSDLPGSDARRRVAIDRCKPCANPHGRGDMPKYLPAELTQYVLNNFSKKSPPYHVTQDDVLTLPQRLEVEQITGHQSVRGEVVSLRCYTRCIGLDSPNLPGSGKWTPTSPAPTSCVIGPEPLVSTAKPTTFTAECGSGRHSASSPATTGNFPTTGLRLCSPRRLAPSLPRHSTS